MSKKSDSFAYGLLGIIAILYVIFETIYHFIIDHYVQIINLSLLVLFTILCLRFLSKKYRWFSFLKILFLKKKELKAYKELEELRGVRNTLVVNYVYLMYDPSLELYKIGHSKDAEFRERTLQGQRPTIELVSKRQYPSRDSARKIESLLHKKFDSKRIRGEWFKLEKTDVDYLKEYLK
tara:strand:+ start:357 stop:893 length:537 start_codon:yes stop_codon:yes gene_type:complete